MRIETVKAGLACLLIVGLAASCAEKVVKKGPTPYDATVVKDCYTVELFSVAKVEEPRPEVPAEWNQLLGVWGKAAWEGKWCHDLHVLNIQEDGTVEVMELHAPYEPWGKPATAFRRKARMTEDNHLRMVYSGVEVDYWLENGRLYGLRKEGGGQMRIALSPGANPGLGI